MVGSLWSGCARLNYDRKELDGSHVKFKAHALFMNNAINKLTLDHVTDKTSKGLAVGSIESDVNQEAIRAVVEAAVQGAVRGIKPTP